MAATSTEDVFFTLAVSVSILKTNTRRRKRRFTIGPLMLIKTFSVGSIANSLNINWLTWCVYNNILIVRFGLLSPGPTPFDGSTDKLKTLSPAIRECGTNV